MAVSQVRPGFEQDRELSSLESGLVDWEAWGPEALGGDSQARLASRSH